MNNMDLAMGRETQSYKTSVVGYLQIFLGDLPVVRFILLKFRHPRT